MPKMALNGGNCGALPRSADATIGGGRIFSLPDKKFCRQDVENFWERPPQTQETPGFIGCLAIAKILQ